MTKLKFTANYWHFLIITCFVLSIALPLFASGENQNNTVDIDNDNGESETVVTEPVAEYTGTASCLLCHEEYKEGFLITRHALSLGDP